MVVETMTAGLAAFIALVANSFTKIMLMLVAVFITFLAIPQSRAAAMLGVAIFSAFAGGILIELHSVEQNWGSALAVSISFGLGFMVYPFLTFFRKFNDLVSKDQEIADLLFAALKSRLGKLLKAEEKQQQKKIDDANTPTK